MKKTVQFQLRNEGEPAGIQHQPGMLLLRNANGDVDTTTLGYQYTIQTTTQIRARIVRQKFYEIAPADYLTVIVGTGAWLENIKTNLIYDAAGPFESGLIQSGVGPSGLARVEVGTAPKTTAIATWAKGYEYTIPEINKALAANQWDVIEAKYKALVKNWQLGIQKVFGLGLLSDLTNFPGLLTQTQVNSNTSVITANISGMDAATFSTFVANILGAYGTNCAFTALPNKFLIPMDDYLGLAAPVSSSFPNVSKLDYLLAAFKAITGNANFKILPLAYGMSTYNKAYVSVSGKARYVLYHDDADTLWMDIPVDLFIAPAGTANNFVFQGVGAGQFAGVTVARPAEVLYFDH